MFFVYILPHHKDLSFSLFSQEIRHRCWCSQCPVDLFPSVCYHVCLFRACDCFRLRYVFLHFPFPFLFQSFCFRLHHSLLHSLFLFFYQSYTTSFNILSSISNVNSGVLVFLFPIIPCIFVYVMSFKTIPFFFPNQSMLHQFHLRTFDSHFQLLFPFRKECHQH